MQNDRNHRVSGYANDFQGAQSITFRNIGEKPLFAMTQGEIRYYQYFCLGMSIWGAK